MKDKLENTIEQAEAMLENKESAGLQMAIDEAERAINAGFSDIELMRYEREIRREMRVAQGIY